MSKQSLGGDLCKNFFYFHILFFFLVFEHDLVQCFDFPISQLQTQQVMTSQFTN